MTLSWRHDSRDSAIFPNTGAVQSLFGEATVPGSDLNYYKISYDHRRYWQLAKDLVVSVNGEIGYGDAYGDTSKLPFFENFFGGGPGSVRGYAARSIGPRDSYGDPLGGNAMYAGNLELLFPPPFMKDNDTVRLATFFDFGSVVDTSETDLFDPDELRYSVGIGASWLSPVGALTVSYAISAENGQPGRERRIPVFLWPDFLIRRGSVMIKRCLTMIALAAAILPAVSLAGDVTVAVVNVIRLQTEAPQVAQVREKIKAEFLAREAKTSTQQEQINQLEQKLLRDRENMSDAEAKSLQRDIRSRKLRLENAKEELESDRRLRLNEEMDHLRRVLSEVIAEVANAEKLDIVLESGVTWASERANITDKVLARMRELSAAEK